MTHECNSCTRPFTDRPEEACQRKQDHQQYGAFCPTAGSIVPLYWERCDWCGNVHNASFIWNGASWDDNAPVAPPVW